MTEDVSGQAEARDAIDFTQRFAGAEAFRTLFREGMGLVEETAAYLDGPGRAESKSLDRTASLVYATESMRLTTRLMQLASWLLLQRAVNEGEMSHEQAGAEKSKVRIDGNNTIRSGPGWDDLPQALKDLVERSLRLQERVKRLDGAIYGPRSAPLEGANPVAAQLGRLANAFGRRD